MVRLAAAVAAVAVLAADSVMVASALRSLIYAIPLVVLLVATPLRAFPFLKTCLLLFIAIALGNVLGLSRGMSNVLAIVPASLLAIHAVRAATGYMPAGWQSTERD